MKVGIDMIGSSVFIQMICIWGYYYLIYKSYQIAIKNGWKRNIVSNKDRVIFLLIFIIYFLVIFCILIREKFVPYWDYGAYWSITLDFQEISFQRPLDALGYLYQSINSYEYNALICYLISIPLMIMGNTYISFLLTIVIMFMVPFVVLMNEVLCIVIKKMTLDKEIRMPSWLNIIIILSFPAFSLPLLKGYVDCIGLPIIASILLITFSRDWFKVEKRENIFLSVLLILLMVIRRYYAYFVLGYAVTVIIYAIYMALVKKECKGIIINVLNIGVVSFLILIIFFNGFVKQSVFNNFSVSYSAYNNSNFRIKVNDLVGYFGKLTVILGGLGVGLTYLRSKRNITIPIFFIVNSIVALGAFWRIQWMAVHHYYIVAVYIFLLCYIGVLEVYNWIKKYFNKKISKIVIILIILLFVENSLYGFTNIESLKNGLILQNGYKIRKRNDMDSIYALRDYIRKITQQRELIYILASSEIFNSDILYKTYLPEKNCDLNLASVAHIDLRDGFSTSFFDSKVVIVCTPVQYHLESNDQQVIGELSKLLLDSENIIGDNYIFLNEFFLDNQVTAKVYLKNEEFTKEEILYVEEIFEKSYKNYRELFSDRIEKYIQQNY